MLAILDHGITLLVTTTSVVHQYLLLYVTAHVPTARHVPVRSRCQLLEFGALHFL